ncbi:MAG: hypothetical protein KC477_16710, partial [Oceanospirillaceae bacterium]|nr:hypothetical protein [Oceanospirillaceae bacterium]
TGTPITHRIELYRSNRIDCYNVVINGNLWKRRIGWRKILEGLRKALPRLRSGLYQQVPVPELETGDIIAMLNTGAYIEPMAANFNALPRPGMVLVNGDQADMIKRHETLDDVFARHVVPARLR